MQQFFVAFHLEQWYCHRFGLFWMSHFRGEELALSKQDYQAGFCNCYDSSLMSQMGDSDVGDIVMLVT